MQVTHDFGANRRCAICEQRFAFDQGEHAVAIDVAGHGQRLFHGACLERVLRGLPPRATPDPLPVPRGDTERLARARESAGRAILALRRATEELQRLSDAARGAMEALREVNDEIWNVHEGKRDEG